MRACPSISKVKTQNRKKKIDLQTQKHKTGSYAKPSFFFYVLITTKIDESVILEDVTLYYYTQHLQCKFINQTVLLSKHFYYSC